MKAALALCCLAGALAIGAAASSAAVGRVPSFAAVKRYPVHYSKATAIGDLNGDGRADVVTVNADETVSVFITKPDGTLRARRDYIAAGGPVGAAIADLNGDGHQDVAVADHDGFVTVFLNTGDGTLHERRDYAGSGPQSIAAGDLDDDGRPDLVTANTPGDGGGEPSLAVFRNNGDGTFAAKQDYPVGGGTLLSVAIGDVDGNGKPDLVAGDSDNHVWVLSNNGDGSFQPGRGYQVVGAASVALGDLNGDGKLDVATADGAYRVSVLLNAGDGTLQRSRSYPVLPASNTGAPDPQSIVIGDLNGDHRADLATANFDRHVSLLLNAGGGIFRAAIDVGAERCGYVDNVDHAIATGDLNGDGRADLAVAGSNGLCLSLARLGLCNVQDVVGLKVRAARSLLARGHCRVGAIRYGHARFTKKGRITAQRPGFGRVLRSGAKVRLAVSLGP